MTNQEIVDKINQDVWIKWNCQSGIVSDIWYTPIIWAGSRVEIYTPLICKWKKLRKNYSEKELEQHMKDYVNTYFKKDADGKEIDIYIDHLSKVTFKIRSNGIIKYPPNR